MRSRIWALAAILALAGCGGAAQSACTTAANLVPAVVDPMTSPADGATNVPTTIGSITAPDIGHLIGLTVTLTPSSGNAVTGGQFAKSGLTNVSATIPNLAPNTRYLVTAAPYVTGVPCSGPTTVQFGSFATGPS